MKEREDRRHAGKDRGVRPRASRGHYVGGSAGGRASIEFPFTVRLGGLSTLVQPDGTFEIAELLAADEDGDQEVGNEVHGEVGGGAAKLEVSIFGVFDRLGIVNPLGLLACESWGEDYEARRQ